jgi:DNA-binding response OmpR family regulator
MPGARLLLVEDEAALASLLCRYLERAGFQVVIAATGAAAQEAWDSSFQGAVIDLGLPDVDGGQLVQALLERHVAPVVISSGTPTDVAVLVGPDRRALVLQKPYLPGELLKAIESLIETAPAGA